MRNRTEKDIKASDFVPIFGFANYVKRNPEERSPSEEIVRRSGYLYIYNFALSIVVATIGSCLEQLFN